jgi:hypothetical protein
MAACTVPKLFFLSDKEKKQVERVSLDFYGFDGSNWEKRTFNKIKYK